MGLFGKDEDENGNAPVNRVQNLSQQGYSNTEITNMLRDEGFSYSQINQALNRAVTQHARNNQGQGQPSNPPQRGSSGLETFQGQQSGGGMPGQQQGRGQGVQQLGEMEQFGQGKVSEEEEEAIESIVAEYFADIEDEFDNVYVEIDAIIDKIHEMEERLHDLEIRKDEDQKRFFSKMDSLENTVESTSGRVGGLEKAFQNVLPQLVENVRELTGLVQDMKQGSRSARSRGQ